MKLTRKNSESLVWEEQKKVKNEKEDKNFLSMEKLQKVTKNSSSVYEQQTNTTEEERTTSFHNNNNNNEFV